MKIIAINGSPRGENSTTYLMVEEFLKGARSSGAKTDHILLSKLNIHHCIGCMSCWTRGVCVFDDDINKISQSLKDVDILVYATPLYVDNVTGLMKKFMERCIAFGCPFMEKDIEGESVHVKKDNKMRKIVVISNCGFPEQSQFEVIKLLFERIARNMQGKVIAEIYRGGGPLLKQKNKELEPIVNDYKDLLQRAGKEVAESLQLSQKTKEELEKPLIPHELYLEMVNKHFEEELSKS